MQIRAYLRKAVDDTKASSEVEHESGVRARGFPWRRRILVLTIIEVNIEKVLVFSRRRRGGRAWENIKGILFHGR